MTHEESQSHFDANFSEIDMDSPGATMESVAQPMVPMAYPSSLPALPAHSMPARPNRKLIRQAEQEAQRVIHAAEMTNVGIQCTAALVQSARQAAATSPQGEAAYVQLVQAFVESTGNRIRRWGQQ